MQVVLELLGEVESTAIARAAQRGLSVPDYLLSLVKSDAPAKLPEPKHLSREEFQTSLDGMAQYSYKIPLMPNETFSREMIYEDHD